MFDVEQFLVENIKLVTEENFTALYKRLSGAYGLEAVPQLTSYLFKLNINPLNKMDDIPTSYATGLNITNVDIPEGIKRINADAFANCKKIEKVDIPQSVVIIGAHAFDSASHLKEVSISDNVGYILSRAFAKTAVKTLRLSNSIKIIHSSCFAECEELESLIIPDSVKFIGAKAFSGCIKLNKLTLGSNVLMMDVAAFEKCYDLKEINFNGTMETWNRRFGNISRNYLPPNLQQIKCVDGII